MDKCDSYTLLCCDCVWTTEMQWGVMLFDGAQLVRFWCPCGCGIEAVLNVMTEGEGRGGKNEKGQHVWRLLFDTDMKPSLSPSIMANGFKCKSHYFIENGKVRWC